MYIKIYTGYCLAAAVEEYKKMKAETANYYIYWIQMYYVADKLFTLKRYWDARIIGKNNVLKFPERGLVMLALGGYLCSLKQRRRGY
jgi:hypothetical protein